MTLEHDFKKNPEIWNSQLTRLYHKSPHQQILRDFNAHVVKVTDGDSIRVTTTFRDFSFPIRLLTVAAPELKEGGETAQAWLEDRLFDQDIFIKVDFNQRVGKWGRLLGRVIHKGIDINEELKRRRLAVEFK